MAFNSKHRIQPGQVSESSNEPSTYEGSPDTMYYPGFQPQMYQRPMQPHVYREDGEVQNNTDRGTEAHGVYVDSHVAPKDHMGLVETHDAVPQRMPEADDNREPAPVKVEIVNRDPDEIVALQVDVFNIGTPTLSSQGTSNYDAVSPVRILNKDPHRTRALIAISNMTGGTLPVIRPKGGSHKNGFPLSMASQVPLELFVTEEVYISGSARTDSFTVTVLIERTTNADRLHGD